MCGGFCAKAGLLQGISKIGGGSHLLQFLFRDSAQEGISFILVPGGLQYHLCTDDGREVSSFIDHYLYLRNGKVSGFVVQHEHSDEQKPNER